MRDSTEEIEDAVVSWRDPVRGIMVECREFRVEMLIRSMMRSVLSRARDYAGA
jgi:hypothetical protein